MFEHMHFIALLSCNHMIKILIQKYTRYRPQTKLRKGNVFTPVCQSFCSQGSTPVHAGICHPQGRHLPWAAPWQTPPWADTPRQTTPWAQPPGETPHKQTATAADGTYPTGMHSCFKVCKDKTILQRCHQYASIGALLCCLRG